MICPKCNRVLFYPQGQEHSLCISSDVKKAYVVHDFYGCDTGCDGHSVIIINNRNQTFRYFRFESPYDDEDHTSFINRLIKDQFSEIGLTLNFDLIDYESCVVFDD